MHFFGSIGAIMFTVGFGLFFYLGARKVWNLINDIPAKNIADISWFYIGLTAMILGTLLFCTGFLAELVSRNSPRRNVYLIETKLGIEESENVHS
ncbi:MAG: hypothetical protein COA99_02775 [Moraxellaceae bacterium]|nr:MAG: hypothetical protein COA99_02775 [Moraxellaceae bacterium]